MERDSRPNRVLIIDDDLMSREVLALLLTGAGSQVETEVSGEAALNTLRDTESFPSVVLADVQMPGIAGRELASALRTACPAETLLLAMSGSQPSARSLELFDGFLLKPFQPEALAAIIANRMLPQNEASSCNESGNAGYHQSGITSHGGGTAPQPDETSKPHMSTHSYQGQPTNFMAASAPVSPEAALDRRIYKQLGATMRPKQLKEMYQLCLDDVRNRITAMRALANAREGEPFVRQAHTIKGSCGMLGASELSRMAGDLEKSGLSAAGLDGRTGVNPLDELAAACDRLERILGTRT